MRSIDWGLICSKTFRVVRIVLTESLRLLKIFTRYNIVQSKDDAQRQSYKFQRILGAVSNDRSGTRTCMRGLEVNCNETLDLIMWYII